MALPKMKFLLAAHIVSAKWLASFALRLSNAALGEYSDDCSEPGRYCADDGTNRRWLATGTPDFFYRCPQSRCLPCNLDPDGSENGLTCKLCALDFGTKLPMCTECEEDLVAHVFNFDASRKHKRWLCQLSSVKRSQVPSLCSPGPVNLNGGSLGELWKVQDQKSGDFLEKLVKLSEIKESRGPLVDGYHEYVTIVAAVHPMDSKNTSNWVSAEHLFAFKVYKDDTWVRSSPYLKTHPELLPTDSEGTVWYLDDAFQSTDGWLEVQVGFVKHAYKGLPYLEKRRVNNAFDRGPEISVPKMRLSEPVMQTLGACYDFWIKGRKPREFISRPALQILFRAASYIDSKVETSKAVFRSSGVDSQLCSENEYCTFGPRGHPCHPPGRCLPCHLDYTGHDNGLTCSRCQLNTINGIRYSVPTCSIDGESTCDNPADAVKLRDETNVRVRFYCRPSIFELGSSPRLCQTALQGGLVVASENQFWYRKKEGETRWERVLARLQPLPDKYDGFIKAYFIFLPETLSVVEESAAHWSMAASKAKQMLMFKLRPSDKLMSLPDSSDDSVFEYLGSREDSLGRTQLNIAFKTELRDEHDGERLVSERVVYGITKESLLAVATCVESFQKEEVVTALEPQGYLDALSLAGVDRGE